MRTMQEIIFQGYVQLVLAEIRDTAGLQQSMDSGLAEDFYHGYGGLSFDLCRRFLGCLPLLSAPRETAKSKNFAGFACNFPSRLQLLFDWNDGFSRSWDRQPFRQRARRFYQLLSDNLDSQHAEKFKRSLGSAATQFLWIVPRFEGPKLHMSIKVNPHHTSHRQEQLLALTPPQRVQWITAVHSMHGRGGPVDRDIPRYHPEWLATGWRFVDQLPFGKLIAQQSMLGGYPPTWKRAKRIHQQFGL